MAHARISKADSSRSQHVNSCLYVDDFAKKLAKAKEDWRPPAQEPKVEGESMEERVQVNRLPFAHDGGSRRGCFGRLRTHLHTRVTARACGHVCAYVYTNHINVQREKRNKSYGTAEYKEEMLKKLEEEMTAAQASGGQVRTINLDPCLMSLTAFPGSLAHTHVGTVLNTSHTRIYIGHTDVHTGKSPLAAWSRTCLDPC